MGADSVGLGVQGLRNHMHRINLLLASRGRKAEFAELSRGRFRDSANVSSQNICSVHLMRVSTPLLA